MDRDTEWYEIVENYLSTLETWGVKPDQEDASTAPITSLVLEEAYSQHEYQQQLRVILKQLEDSYLLQSSPRGFLSHEPI